MLRFVLAVLIAALASPVLAQGKTEVLWLGQAAFRITTPGGKVIVIDPWLKTNPKTPPGFKNLAGLGKVDLVLVTHAHFDHVSDAAELAKMNKARLFAPPGLSGTLVTLGEIPADLAPGMNKSGIATPLGPEIKFNMVRAEHSSEYRGKDPATGQERMFPGGEPVGWIIELENGFKIYHMGDTGLFGDMKMIGEMYKPDLVLVPIGGNFTINAQQAAYAMKEMLKPRFAIPMHYGTYPILAGKPEDFVKGLEGSSTRAIVMNPGDKVDF
jgi:L-ascorbate metabolism protein UlaG (beta-lactamase superfamily)